MPNTAAEVQFTVANSLSRAVTAAPTLVPQSAAEKHADDAKKIRVRSQVNPHRFQIHRGQPFIVTAKDLQSIVDSVNDLKVSTSVVKPQVPLPVRIKKEHELKESLREKSKAKAAAWQDTLINIRRRKLKEHLDRQEREEAERQRIDREFAEEEQKRREQAVKRAQNLIYSQEDHVKIINSEILYDLVQQERDAQLELKQQQQQQMTKINQQWHEMKEEQARKQLEREVREQEYSERVQQDLAKSQREEYLRIQRQKEESKRQKLDEGKAVINSDSQYQEKNAARQAHERQQQKERFQNLQHMIEEKKKREQQLIDKQQQQEEEIRKWAEKRDHLDHLRKEAEERYLNEKIRIRDKIGNDVWMRLENERNAKNDWVEMRIKETQEREAGKRAQQLAKEAALKADMEQSIKNTAEKNAERERQRKELNERVKQENIALRIQLQKEAQEKRRLSMEKQREISAHNKKEMELKRQLKREAKEERDQFNQGKIEQESNDVKNLREYIRDILNEPWMQSNPRAKTTEQYENRAWHPLK